MRPRVTAKRGSALVPRSHFLYNVNNVPITSAKTCKETVDMSVGRIGNVKFWLVMAACLLCSTANAAEVSADDVVLAAAGRSKTGVVLGGAPTAHHDPKARMFFRHRNSARFRKAASLREAASCCRTANGSF